MLKSYNAAFILVFFLAACKSDLSNMNKYYFENAVEVNNPIIDSACYPEVFQNAFAKGYNALSINEYELTFSSFDIGKIKIISGKITAGDPGQVGKLTPFDVSFPIGEFSVQIAVTKENQTAFSRIIFNDSPVVRWEMATKNGQKPHTLDSDNISCFGVDGGIALYMDMDSQIQFEKNGIEEVMEVTFMKFFDMDPDAAQFVNYHFDGYNLVCVQTGEGDGCYGSYIGYNDKNEICQFLSDFQLIDWKSKN